MPVVTPRRLAGAAAVPALALVLTACDAGGSKTDAPALLSPEQVVLASYEGLESESYQMQSVVTMNDIELMEMVESVDGESSRAIQDIRLSAMVDVMGSMGEQMPDDPAAAAMMEAIFADMHTETVIVDEMVYINVSGGMLDMSEEFGADAWFTADVTEFGLEDVYEQVGGVDLAAQTEALITDLTDVKETGDGVYTGTLNADSEALQGLAGAAVPPGAQELFESVEIVITVDDEGLLETLEITLPELVEGTTIHMSSQVVEIGGDYDITAPESDNLHPFEDFVGSISEFAGSMQ